MGLIVKREDGSEQVNYDDESFPSYIYDGWIKPNVTWEKVPHFHEDVEIVTVTVGGKTESKKGFGKKASHVVGGFTTTEYRIFDGSEIEEPDEDDTNSKFLTDKDVRKAKQMRKTVAEAKIKKAKEKASEKASEGSSKGLGKYKKSSVDDEDIPVDDEDPFFN